MDKLQIEDLIAMSGGLKEGADRQVISVSRRLKNGSFKTLSQNFKVFSSNKLELVTESNFILEPYDIVTVRYLKGHTVQKSIRVKGGG